MEHYKETGTQLGCWWVDKVTHQLSLPIPTPKKGEGLVDLVSHPSTIKLIVDPQNCLRTGNGTSIFQERQKLWRKTSNMQSKQYGEFGTNSILNIEVNIFKNQEILVLNVGSDRKILKHSNKAN